MTGRGAPHCGLIVSRHAMDRYRERVADLPDAAIFSHLSTPAFEAAVFFGCPSVRLPTGHRAIIEDLTIVTVLPKGKPLTLADPKHRTATS